MPQTCCDWVQESASPAKESSITSEGESGSGSQDALISQEERLGKAGAAVVNIPKAEKDVDDFDVRSNTQIPHLIAGETAPWPAELAVILP